MMKRDGSDIPVPMMKRDGSDIPVPMMKRDGSDRPKIFHHTNIFLITSMVMWHQRQVFGGLKLRKNDNNLKQG